MELSYLSAAAMIAAVPCIKPHARITVAIIAATVVIGFIPTLWFVTLLRLGITSSTSASTATGLRSKQRDLV
jgi:hypothetical protein